MESQELAGGRGLGGMREERESKAERASEKDGVRDCRRSRTA